MSPLAMPWSINSSMMNEVSPGGFYLLNGSDFIFWVFRGLEPFLFLLANGFAFDGPLARLCMANLAAYSFVKQSHIPSHALIMKS
jgi:hypothetical protein